jgi:hypothetical protein
MLGFEDLTNEAKDRFLKDKFWSAVFLTFILCNYDVVIILVLSDNEKVATPTIKSGPLNRRPHVDHLPTQACNFSSIFQ